MTISETDLGSNHEFVNHSGLSLRHVASAAAKASSWVNGGRGFARRDFVVNSPSTKVSKYSHTSSSPTLTDPVNFGGWGLGEVTILLSEWRMVALVHRVGDFLGDRLDVGIGVLVANTPQPPQGVQVLLVVVRQNPAVVADPDHHRHDHHAEGGREDQLGLVRTERRTVTLRNLLRHRRTTPFH